MTISKETKLSCILNNNSYSDLKNLRELLLNLKTDGKEYIVIEENELLDNEEFIKVLNYIKYASLKIKLKTDGVKLIKNYDILKHIDIIELRIDAIDPNILRELNKRDDLYIKNISNYNYIREDFPNIKIDIKTYLNRLNLIDIINLASIIENLDISEWNLFREDISSKYKMSEKEFNVMVKCLKESKISTKIKEEEVLPSFQVQSSINQYILLKACY